MARRSRGRRGHGTEHLGRRQSTSIKGLGAAIVALIALLALGGQVATGAAGCFSTMTERPQAEGLEVGGGERQPEEKAAPKPSFKVRVEPANSP